ncbi:MAG: response regulator [Planctomycetales bacterium]
MRILIVDDDEMALDLLENALTRDGYEVLRASNGNEALAILRKGNCRLVISDWEMPGMSGLDLCRTIRSRDFGGYVYVIMLTSHQGMHDFVEGMSAGADDFITKPFNPVELGIRLRVGRRIISTETRDVTIFALAKLAESRDPETGHHLERVQSYSLTLAEQLSTNPKFFDSIDDEFIRLVYLTSPLHDIGKVGIPDAVLLKPGRLSNEEFEIMKFHATLGAQTLDAAREKFPDARFLQVARDIAAHHHERWDGGGYPDGLAGTKIPLCARIVSLADVYDALTSKRVYKAAFSHLVARSIILEGSGSHFDPDVVEAFQQREKEFVEIRERFSPPEDHASAAPASAVPTSEAKTPAPQPALA